MGKQGIFEYVNLQKKTVKSKNGVDYNLYVLVGDTKIKKDTPLWKEIHNLGFFWNGFQFQIYTNKMTQNILNALKEINVKMKESGNETGNIDDFQDLLEKMREEIGESEIPLELHSQLEIRIKNFIDKLVNGTDEESERLYQQFLSFSSKLNVFHKYSEKNLAYIFAQKPDATKVASRSVWKELGRDIIDEKKVITINCGNNYYVHPRFGYTEYTPKQQRADKEYEYKVQRGYERPNPAKMREIETRRKIVKVEFGACGVYDYSNTTGRPLPVEPELNFNSDDANDNRADATALFNIAKKSLEKNGITVTQDPSMGGEAGWRNSGQINVSSNVTGTYAASTILTQWAHELLHQPNGKFYSKTTKYFEEKGSLSPAQMKQIKDVQAKTVAAVICKHYDIPTNQHPTEMQLLKTLGGLDSRQIIGENYTVISSVCNHIIKEIKENEGEIQAARTQQPAVNESILLNKFRRKV